MVKHGLDKNLETIVGTGSLQTVIFNLVNWAESEGQLTQLVQAAIDAKPGNESLRTFAKQFGIIPSSTARLPLVVSETSQSPYQRTTPSTTWPSQSEQQPIKPSTTWRPWADHPAVVLLAVLAAVVTIIGFGITLSQQLGQPGGKSTPTAAASMPVSATTEGGLPGGTAGAIVTASISPASSTPGADSLLTVTPTSIPAIFPAPTLTQVVVGWELAGYSKQASLVRDSRGNVTVFARSPDGDLGYIYSSDDGGSWSKPTIFDHISPPGADQVSAAIDSADRTHVVWGRAPEPGDARYGLLDGNTWVMSETVGTGVFARDIAVDSADHPHIVWTNVDVFHTTFNGQIWLGPERVTSGLWHPDILINAQDDLFLFLNDAQFYPVPGVSVYALNNIDARWNEPTKISGSPFWSGGASAAIDSQGSIYVAWIGASSPSGGEDQVFFSRYVGGGWQEPFPLAEVGTSAGSTGQESPAVAFDANDVFYVFWRGLNNKHRPVIFTRALGTENSKLTRVTPGWSPIIQLDDRDARDVGWPSVADVKMKSRRVGVDVVWSTSVGRNNGIDFSHVAYP
jgi:hypothetical protein